MIVAFASAPSEIALQRIERAAGLPVLTRLAPAEYHSDATCARYTVRRASSHKLRRVLTNPPQYVNSSEPSSPGILQKAPDVHLEPDCASVRVRFRVDGILREAKRLDDALATAVISRVKVLAGMDIAEKRAPQDGTYSFNVGGRRIDARVSSVPVRNGEKLALASARSSSERSCSSLGKPRDALSRS